MVYPRVGKSDAPGARPFFIIPEKVTGKKERFQEILSFFLREAAVCGRLKKTGESRKGRHLWNIV